ncbi:MAG: DUF4058 family protein [Planctomycetes bacterium]|nr:DUF4058 family protein [Planctomycetota bacterium]
MPIHDWTRVEAGIFHHFHHSWIEELQRALNRDLLPADYYALAEQITGRLGPDVLTLRKPVEGAAPVPRSGGVATAPLPRTRFHARAEAGRYAAKSKSVVVRHRSNHDVVAMIEIVSPGNKDSQRALSAFVHKAEDALAAGIHLLIVDLFPPTSRDPLGIHRAIWADREDTFVFAADRPLTCVSYLAGECPEAFVEPTAVGDALPTMPLFLTPDQFVSVPLEAAYQPAWDALPAYWRQVVAGGEPQ